MQKRIPFVVLGCLFLVAFFTVRDGSSHSPAAQINLHHLHSEIEMAAAVLPTFNQGLIADPSSNLFYVPPRILPGRAPQTATFSVNWNPDTCLYPTSDWNADAQAAFAYALDIWESLIVSTVPIVVDACWSPLGSNVLGSAGAVNIVRNFDGAPQSDVWYPIGLTNAITRMDQNGSSSEIMANFSSQFSNWYYGTDGNPAFNQYDFVSVVLHEVGHGLGFAGSMTVDGNSGEGYYGYFNNPYAFDPFTENRGGVNLVNSYGSGTVALGNQLTGGNLYFDGAAVRAANGGNPAQLYAPETWAQGSSYSHLDTTFDGTDHALMTHSIANGEAIHDPGEITLGLFSDMGWTISNSIQATPTPSPTQTSTPPAVATNTPSPTPMATNTPPPTSTPNPVGTPIPEPTNTPVPDPTTPPEPEDENETYYFDQKDSAQENVTEAYPLDDENLRWQKFVPKQDNVSVVELWLEVTGSSPEIEIKIEDSDDNELGGTKILAGNAQFGWNTVEFSTPISLVPGQAYKISVIGITTGRAPTAEVEWGGGAASTFCLSCSSDVSSINTQYSYAFITYSRTYMENRIFVPMVQAE